MRITITESPAFFTRKKALLAPLCLVVLAAFLCLASCRENKDPTNGIISTSELNVYALQEIRDTGFESAVLKEFAAQNGTKLDLTLFPDLPSLLDTLAAKTDPPGPDLVLGLDNAFVLDDSLLLAFDPLPEISLREIRRQVPRDPARKLVPYACANLTLLYDSNLFPQPPRSFGELQDARYYAELALCDPRSSGLGRSSLLWFLSIFGEQGYAQLLNSLRMNVRKVYADRFEALDALRKGECTLMLGFDSTPAWIAEFSPADARILSSMPREGSFLYVRSAAVCKDAPNQETAVKFLEYLISPEAQQFVMYKLGMMPVNGRAPLPNGFDRVPLDVYATNSRLDEDLARQSMARLLQIWTVSFTPRPIY